jgi:hypothetical protein
MIHLKIFLSPISVSRHHCRKIVLELLYALDMKLNIYLLELNLFQLLIVGLQKAGLLV